MRTPWDIVALMLLYLGYAFIYAGLLFHTSPRHRAVVIRKYSYCHTVLLIMGLLPFYFIPIIVPTARQAVLLVGVVLAALVGWEFVLQARWARGARTRLEGEWPFHPFLQTCRRPDSARGINRWGMRGADIDMWKPAGAYRIFLQGDSAFENEWTAYEESLAGVLEAELKARAPVPVEIQNAAVAWHSTQHSLIDYLFRLQDFRPDLLIICHGVNDLYRGFSAPSVTLADMPYQSDYSHFWGVLAPVIQEYEKGRPLIIPQKLARLARHYLFSDWRPQPWGGSFLEYFKGSALIESEVYEFRSLGAFERNLRSIVETYRLKGSDVILATQPSLYEKNLGEAELRRIGIPQRYARDGNRVASIASMKRGMEAFNDVTRRVARDLGCGLVDLEPMLPKTIEYFANDVHYTALANRLIGETLADFVLGKNYLLNADRKVEAHLR